MEMNDGSGFGNKRWIWIMDYAKDWTMISDLVWRCDNLAHVRIA